MADILLRNLADAELAVLDARAAELGLSRSEFLRRLIRKEVSRREVTVADLHTFGDLVVDLGDAEVMAAAWS